MSVQVHLHRVGRFGADLERHCREVVDQNVTALESLDEIVCDQPPDLLCLEVVRVVVAVREP